MRNSSLLPRAFTLVELLASLAVISVLIALSMGGFSVIQKKGDHAKCLYNLRQLHMAFLQYTTDHNNDLPDKNPKRMSAYFGMPDADLYSDSPYTCPAIQRTSNRAVGALHRNIAINVYATSEKGAEPHKVSRILMPSKMLLFTEGTVMGDEVDPDGKKGKVYLSNTRPERFAELQLPHRNLQNAVFVDGSARQIDGVEFYQEGRWNTPFWRGY